MQGDGEDPESPGRALRERGRSEKKSNFPGNGFSQYLLVTDFHDMYLFNMEPKVKQFIISVIDLNLQANLEEFVANEKVDDESDSDDTDSGTLHNVYFVQYDVPVSFLAQVLDTGTYFFSLYILRILAFYAPNLVYDTGSYFGGNHGSRV